MCAVQKPSDVPGPVQKEKNTPSTVERRWIRARCICQNNALPCKQYRRFAPIQTRLHSLIWSCPSTEETVTALLKLKLLYCHCSHIYYQYTIPPLPSSPLSKQGQHPAQLIWLWGSGVGSTLPRLWIIGCERRGRQGAQVRMHTCLRGPPKLC